MSIPPPPTSSRPGSSGAWASNASVDEIAAFLHGKRRIVVLTHAKPDGDALGSALALTRALNLSGLGVAAAQRATAHFFGPIPAFLKQIVAHPAGSEATSSVVLHENTAMPMDVEADAVVVVDTGSWTQLEPAKAWLATRGAITCLVDHHVQGNAEVAAWRCIETSAAAACQPVARLCLAVLRNATSATGLPASVAEPLFLGLATDTGWFKHSNVSRAVMQLGGELIQAGADNVWLYQTLEQNETLGRLRLLSKALASLELRLENRFAILAITQADMRASGALPGETGGLTDFTQNLPTVQVSALLSEVPAGPEQPGVMVTKISMRSKPGPVDVNAIAGTLGGGGHVRAAGAKVAKGIEETKQLLTDLVRKSLEG
jgi:bifunctional oligoribonuclease and PAP phosphatase NrnA